MKTINYNALLLRTCGPEYDTKMAHGPRHLSNSQLTSDKSHALVKRVNSTADITTPQMSLFLSKVKSPPHSFLGVKDTHM